jgi:hypothetical protein
MLTNFAANHFGYFKRRRFKLTLILIKEIFQKKALYYKMPKVASESVSHGLDINTTSIPHFFRPRATKRLMSLNSKLFKFTFVRHPLDRFVSAYKWAIRETICPKEHPEDYRQREVIQSCSDINDFCSKLPLFINSEQYQLIHFIPQSHFLYNKDRSLMDFIGKYENMNNDIEFLRNTHTINIDFKFGPNIKSANIESDTLIDVKMSNIGLTPESIELLKQIYAQDYKLFGY